MGFPGRLEIAVYAEMYFQSAVLKLATAPGSQMWWFLQFRYSEQPLLKFAGFFLSTFRHSQLNVVQGFNPHGLPSYSRFLATVSIAAVTPSRHSRDGSRRA